MVMVLMMLLTAMRVLTIMTVSVLVIKVSGDDSGEDLLCFRTLGHLWYCLDAQKDPCDVPSFCTRDGDDTSQR
eukprot:1707199-Pyramimonas_sp.AAC.1